MYLGEFGAIHLLCDQSVWASLVQHHDKAFRQASTNFCGLDTDLPYELHGAAQPHDVIMPTHCARSLLMLSKSGQKQSAFILGLSQHRNVAVQMRCWSPLNLTVAAFVAVPMSDCSLRWQSNYRPQPCLLFIARGPIFDIKFSLQSTAVPGRCLVHTKGVTGSK